MVLKFYKIGSVDCMSSVFESSTFVQNRIPNYALNGTNIGTIKQTFSTKLKNAQVVAPGFSFFGGGGAGQSRDAFGQAQFTHTQSKWPNAYMVFPVSTILF